ncbi:LysE family transporter [Cellvibrio sp. OA-2007]|uniref:LysE family transporter n=1 Tax=Cellvibrio sp. OA-2007 TaxID=529823 RepID=UPI00078303AE|nr:LysE family transporter [Cellvibrio sp. OA-2007]
MSTLFISAFVLGLIFNAAPGAVFAETVRQGARGGFKSALMVQLGSLVGDATWALLGLIGVGLLLQLEFLRVPVGIAGAIYLLWLACDSWRSASQEFAIGGAGVVDPQKAMHKGMILSLTNPHNIAYWAALGSAMGAVGVSNPTLTDYGIFFVGFMVSSILWSFFCAAVVARLFKHAKRSWVKLTYKLCAFAFLLLAISSIKSLFAEANKTTHSAEQYQAQPAPRQSR